MAAVGSPSGATRHYILSAIPPRKLSCTRLWRPEPAALQRIDEQGDEWRAVRNDRAMKRSWTFDGDSLKRAPKGFPANHPLIEDIKRTDFIVIHTMSEAEIGRGDLVKKVTSRYATAAPLMRFLCKAVGVQF